VTVEFNLDKLGLRGREISAINALTDKPIALTADGKISLSLGSEKWVYVLLRPKKAKP